MKYTPGIDLSHYQTDDGVNPKRYFDPKVAKDKGIQFAILKASEPYMRKHGNRHEDPAVDVLAASFIEAGIPIGFYHFVRPPSYGMSAERQAEIFYDVVEPYLDNAKLPCFLDIEVEGLGLAFLENMAGRLDFLTERITGIYTRNNVWKAIRGSESATWAAHRPYWGAAYFYATQVFPQYHIPDIVINSTTLPRVPLPWKRWNFWQYSDKGNGEYYGGDYASWTDKTGLDLNVFNGDLMEFMEYIGSGEVVNPGQPAEEMYVRVIARKYNGSKGWLYFRNRPSLYKGASLAVGYGTILKVLSPNKIPSEETEFWHVESDDREGYVSAKPEYTEVIVR